jgi:predicted nucleotidyltransferase
MNKSILVRIDRDPLFGMTREEYIEELIKKLKGRVTEAYIFGSFNGNGFGRFNDIDLLLITDSSMSFVKRPEEYSDLLDLIPSTNILVYTPEEFRAIMEKEPVGFWKSVRESMVRII